MSKFLSLSWFKSKIETVVERVITNKLEQLMEQEDPDVIHVTAKPYRKLKFVNDVLTIILNSGEIISKTNATPDDYVNATNAITEGDLLNIVCSKEVRDERIAREKEITKVKALQKGISVLTDLKDFEVENNSVKLAGTGRTMPQLLVEKFIEVVDRYKNTPSENLQDALDADDEYQGLKRFFMWCCLNPRAEVADSLYDFLNKNSFRITKQGFFAALRNVVTIETDNDLVKFVSNAYNKVKAVWKKSPDNYRVVENEGEYSIESVTNTNSQGVIVGNLTTLYLELPNMRENRFTDDWTKTFDIRIGKVVSMASEDCNWSTQDCAAAGLHFTSDQIHYVGCGDQSVLVLINPMKVVGIGQHKGRCYEYLPIMTVPREEATELLHDLDFDVLALDEDFAIRELNNLQEIATQGFSVETKKYDFNIPSISTKEIENIVASLEEMVNNISKRVVNLD